MDTYVLLNLKVKACGKTKIPSAVYSKKFREQAVKSVTEEELNVKEALLQRLSI